MNKVWSPENVSGIYPALTGGLQADGYGLGRLGRESGPVPRL
ncbi:MAG: hypothetical protein ACLVK4_12755 [Alistipes shahii]